MNRREFFIGSAALAGVTQVSVAQAADRGNNRGDVVIVISLRGGADGLNICPPMDGSDRGHYERLRPRLKVPKNGARKAFTLDQIDGTLIGLHPAAAELYELYQSGLVAIFHGVGMPNASRSHFDAQAAWDGGVTGNSRRSKTGMLTRLAKTARWSADGSPMPIVATGTLPPFLLLANKNTTTLNNLSDFGFEYTHWRYQDLTQGAAVDQNAVFKAAFNTDSFIGNAGSKALKLESLIARRKFPKSPTYPDTTIGEHCRTAAQIIKMRVGMRTATIDFGGWDTHEGQNYHLDKVLLRPLSKAIWAIVNDLSASGDLSRTTIIVQSEFGRRVRENANGGTDHGTGNIMFAIGGNVAGGLHGRWPGLDNLLRDEDLKVTTDYRQVWSELCVERLGVNPVNISQIFPGFSSYSPLGVFIP